MSQDVQQTIEHERPRILRPLAVPHHSDYRPIDGHHTTNLQPIWCSDWDNRARRRITTLHGHEITLHLKRQKSGVINKRTHYQ